MRYYLMPKIPRDIGAEKLIKLLKNLGYEKTRQNGSHIRIQCEKNHQIHKVTIPNHNPIKIGTLNNILDSIAVYQRLSKEQLIQKLF